MNLRLFEKKRTDYLFFLDFLLEVSKAELGNLAGYSYALHGRNEKYISSAVYQDLEQAWQFAHRQAIYAAIDCSPLISASCLWETDSCLIQSEDAIDLFGDAVRPTPLSAELFFPNRGDRVNLLRDAKQNSRTEARLTLQSLELKTVTGKLELQIIPIGKNVAYTLEIFTPDD